MEYAIVDIETTGGYAARHGITEIAILIHDGQAIIDRFESLINPQQIIPTAIQALTGIDDAMVANAPLFTEVADKIHELLENRIFVAHNVNFDYSFVKHHLHAAGFELRAPKLCTVRLSRKLFPGLPSYSLGKLTHTLKIPLNNRHRAFGDAMATSILFEQLLAKDLEGLIAENTKKKSKEQVLPAHLQQSEIDKLPNCPGIYYFKDQKGKIIYVGKAKQIKKRVCTHFSGHSTSLQRQNFLKNIHYIDFKPCGTELIALLIEAMEIKKHWPEHNRAMKRFEQKYSLYQFEDQKGYIRLVIDKYRKNSSSIYHFNHLNEAYILLKALVAEHKLCEKLCFVQRNIAACTGFANQICNGACIGEETPALYNFRVKRALKQLQTNLPSFALIDEGREENEKSCLWIEDGKLERLGYFNADTDLSNLNAVKDQLEPCIANDYMMNLIYNHCEQNPHQLHSIKDNHLLNELNPNLIESVKSTIFS